MFPLRLKHSGTFPLHMFCLMAVARALSFHDATSCNHVSLLLVISFLCTAQVVDKLDVHISACDIVGTTLKEQTGH